MFHQLILHLKTENNCFLFQKYNPQKIPWMRVLWRDKNHKQEKRTRPQHVNSLNMLYDFILRLPKPAHTRATCVFPSYVKKGVGPWYTSACRTTRIANGQTLGASGFVYVRWPSDTTWGQASLSLSLSYSFNNALPHAMVFRQNAEGKNRAESRRTPTSCNATPVSRTASHPIAFLFVWWWREHHLAAIRDLECNAVNADTAGVE